MKNIWKPLIIILAVGLTGAFFFRLYIQKTHINLDDIIAESKPSDVKIFFLGIDGATFSVIKPMIAAGELPNFKKLMDGGAHGVLKSEEPMKSPALWTTMATGKSRDKHGIHDFILPNPRSSDPPLVVPMSEHRTAPALWNIASLFKKTVGFTGWWASWPAEEVNGWIVSGAFSHANTLRVIDDVVADGSANITHLTYPDALTDVLRGHLVDPMNPPVDEIRTLADFNDEEMHQLAAVLRPLQGYGLSVLKFSYCTQRAHEEATLELLEKQQPDLAGIMLPLVDIVSHTFWHYYEPDAFPDYNDTDRIKRLKKMLSAVYRHHDHLIGRLLQVLDDDTVIIIVSDHGFKANPVDIKIRPASEMPDEFSTAVTGMVEMGITGDHDIEGVIIACGGPIKKGVQIQSSIYDLFPTVLALMGLPVPKDIEGRVLTEMIQASFLDDHPVKKIPSYSKLMPPHTVPEAHGRLHQESLDMLRGLGYIQ